MCSHRWGIGVKIKSNKIAAPQKGPNLDVWGLQCELRIVIKSESLNWSLYNHLIMRLLNMSLKIICKVCE
jgi:hypothetical protein